MPQPDRSVPGAPCWVDLFTSDPDASTAFYGGLFGWTAESAGDEFGGYINFSKDGQRVAGAMKNDGQSGMGDTWSVYLATDDAEATTASATAHGGQVIVAPMAVADLGTMAVIADAGHAAIGLWQPGAHRGFGIAGEPGAPAWFELHTRDYETSVRFYEEVFGWKTSVASDTPEFRYTTLGEGDGSRAGIMDASVFLPDGVPAHWTVYFGVAHADAALERINELGGSTVLAAEDTPYGRLATAADPTGATFRIITIS